MNSNGELTPLSRKLNRISGTSKGLKRLQNRQIRRRKERQRMFQSFDSVSNSDFRRKAKQWKRKKYQKRKGGIRKETNEQFYKLKKQIRRSQVARNKDQTIRNQMFHPNPSENLSKENSENKETNKQFYKLKKQLRRSQVARDKDQTIRNQMFHPNLSENLTEENSEKIQDKDCILIEQAIEVILIDDDEEKSRILAEENTQASVEKRIDALTSNTSSNPFLSQTSVSDCVVIDTTCKSEETMKEMSDAEKNDICEDCTLVSQQSTPEQNQVEVLSSGTESSDEETSDTSEEDSSTGSDHNQADEKPLFFEDNKGNVRIHRSEVPVYSPLFDKSDIFNATQSQSDDVVFVSSTPVETHRRKKRKKRKCDDSVIFVSEEPAGPSIKNLDFIPLSTDNDNRKLPLRLRELINDNSPPSKKKKKKENGVFTPPHKKAVGNADLFTASERKKNEIYNFNTFNPNSGDDLPRGKRMVIIDGSNVAFGHAHGNKFSVKGIEIAIQYFEKIGHEVKAIVPQMRLKKSMSSDPELLNKLHKSGKVVFTPSKHLPGNSSTSYDDRFILQLAVEFDAAIVSNDNYRDLLNENPAFKKIIQSRVIGYTWCNDLFMLPKDPYGRNGPALSVILNRV